MKLEMSVWVVAPFCVCVCGRGGGGGDAEKRRVCVLFVLLFVLHMVVCVSLPGLFFHLFAKSSRSIEIKSINVVLGNT